MDPNREADRLHVRDLYQKMFNPQDVADQTKIGVSTVKRWCLDLIIAHKESIGDLSREEQLVISLRKQAVLDPDFNLAAYAKTHGLNEHSLRKSITGVTFKYLNSLVPPVVRDTKKPKEKEEARRLYKAGKTFNEIAATLHVSKSSLSLWCRDLVPRQDQNDQNDLSDIKAQARVLYAENNDASITDIAATLHVSPALVRLFCHDLIRQRRHDSRPRKQVSSVKHYVPKEQKLTDEIVIALRQDIRKTGVRNYAKRAASLNISESSLSMAVRGISFRHINSIEPPIEKSELVCNVRPRREESWKKLRPNETLIAEPSGVCMQILKHGPMQRLLRG